LKLTNVSAANAGTYSITVYNAATFATASATLGVVNSPFDWNGDGQTDLLLRTTPGAFMTWSMKGTSIAKSSWLNGGKIFDPAWRFVGLKDLDGDGNKDIVLQDTNGAVLYLAVVGTNFASTNLLGTVPDGWKILDIADFNGDGAGDLVVQNSNGDVGIW